MWDKFSVFCAGDQYYFTVADSGGISFDAGGCPYCTASGDRRKLAGNSENALVNLFSKPGMAIQMMTTSEPDDDMIEVAIQAVEAVFDWRAYERENFHTS